MIFYLNILKHGFCLRIIYFYVVTDVSIKASDRWKVDPMLFFTFAAKSNRYANQQGQEDCHIVGSERDGRGEVSGFVVAFYGL